MDMVPESFRIKEQKRCREAMRRLRQRRRDEKAESLSENMVKEMQYPEVIKDLILWMRGVLSVLSGSRDPELVDNLFKEAEKRGRALSIPVAMDST